MSIIPQSVPFGATHELADENQIKIELQNTGSNRAGSLVITNLSETNSLFISTKENAEAETEEYTLLKSNTISFEYNNDSKFDIYIRGTTGNKFTYFIA